MRMEASVYVCLLAAVGDVATARHLPTAVGDLTPINEPLQRRHV
jgi:hypothetical protein